MQKTYRTAFIFALLTLTIGLTGCQKDQKNPPPAECSAPEALTPQLRVATLTPQSRDDLQRYFLAYNYDWNTVEHGVPPLVINKFPDDFYEMAAGSERTRIFFLTLLPMVLLVNEEIALERNSVAEILERYDRGITLSSTELEQISTSAERYKIDRDPLTDGMARSLLLNRLDQIPPSLCLAQAASESAYGTSRFSRLGNNLFGEMIFSSTAQGIVPLNRPEGKTHRARVFPNLLASLRAYILNLNTHPAYQELRQIRTELRTQGEKVRGTDLARGLMAYSTRKEAYINDILAIIRANNLPGITANATLRKENIMTELLESYEKIPDQASATPLYGRYLLSQN